MSLSKRLRFEILTRDGHTCRYCGGQPPDVVLTVDHVLPTTLGGSDEPSNLTAACKDCNAGKSSMKPGAPTVEQVSADAVRWALAIEFVVETKRVEIADLEADFAQFDARWVNWTLNATGKPLPRNTDWRVSVEIWLKRGVKIDMLCHYVDTAMQRKNLDPTDVWRYYCGIIWKLITELDKEAMALLEMDDTFSESEQLENVRVGL